MGVSLRSRPASRSSVGAYVAWPCRPQERTSQLKDRNGLRTLRPYSPGADSDDDIGRQTRLVGYFWGSGVKGWPSAAVRAMNTRVAGDEQTASRGSSTRVADFVHVPEAMSLLVCTITVVSDRVL